MFPEVAEEAYPGDYKSTENKNDVRCNTRAFSTVNKVNPVRTFSMLLKKNLIMFETWRLNYPTVSICADFSISSCRSEYAHSNHS